MKRVSVIGCPGAGKTMFSRELAQLVELPLVHLDLIYHDQSKPYQNDRAQWRDRVLTEVSNEQWLIDGNYKSTFDIRLPRSDTIIYLDYPTFVSIWRAVKRRLQYRNSVRPDMPPTWDERMGWDFFVFIIKFNHTIAPAMRLQLQSHKDAEVVILKNPRQAKAYLDNLGG